MDYLEQFKKAVSKYKATEAEIKTDKRLTPEGMVEALEAAEREFIIVWQKLESELSGKIFEAEEELAKLEENPPARPSPTQEQAAIIQYEADMLLSVLMSVSNLTSFIAELAKIRSGSPEQKQGFLLAFSRLVELPEKLFGDDTTSKARAAGQLKVLYQEAAKDTLPPEGKAYAKKIEEIEARRVDFIWKKNMMERLAGQAGIHSLTGTVPDPWRRAAAGLN